MGRNDIIVNERRRYMCHDCTHWMWNCSTINRKRVMIYPTRYETLAMLNQICLVNQPSGCSNAVKCVQMTFISEQVVIYNTLLNYRIICVNSGYIY